MGWVSEARAVYQNKYGHYVNKCKDVGIKPITYTEFKDVYLVYNGNIKAIIENQN